ncbi:NifB/NifX family molybdenum-iron cluster-binding protein [Parathalassolituus penaei]|uniref:Nitrogen fixation protein n=1 Tax=Parathalassolituus penaei TaxID=2997323 RepID=A0A9X3EAV6_9GAMM|nr:hypothetical protein [Parathalassolituus penaei]MCY0963840.1 hypothetical protein [Parathalassolituus penaei]
MSEQILVAVAVNADNRVAGHAGRALEWQVFAVVNGQVPEPVWNISLTDAGSLHEWHVRDNAERHPLHAVDIALAASAGDGVIFRLAERDTRLLLTSETSPLEAVVAWQMESLPLTDNPAAGCLNPVQREQRQASLA